MVKYFSRNITAFPALLLIYFLFLSASVNAQDINVRAYTDTTDYNVGDYIHYTVEAEYDKNITVITPDVKKYISNVDVISEDAPQTEVKDNKVVTSFRFILSRYDSADVLIPSIPVKYGIDIDTAGRVPFLANEDTTLSAANSNEVKFTVHTVKVNVEEDIKDVKPPLTIPPDWRIIALWVLAGILLAVLAVYLYRRYRIKKAVPVKKRIIVIPPHTKALDSLKQLEREALWQKGDIKLYHTRITEIIRNYFEERFSLPALELSTSEIVIHLLKYPEAENITSLTGEFLNNADLVKFAKYIPLNSINEEMMKQAVEIVERSAVTAEVKEDSNV